MKNTAWHNEQICQHILSTNFPPLNESDHWQALKDCMDKIEPSRKGLVELGCCKAEFVDAFPDYYYVGADLEHIIEGVSRKVKPLSMYKHFDANKDDYSFIQHFDTVLMNSFLSEIPTAMQILDNVLQHAYKYVLIHRQDIADNQRIEVYQTYGGLEAINYVMSRSELESLLVKHECEIVIETQPYKDHPEKRSLLISK